MQGYGDVVAALPVTERYVRRSTKGAAWFLGRVLAELLRGSGLNKQDIDGLCVSSFTLFPDTAVPFLQQAGLSPRFLEFLPTGGACGVMALRRAARAVQMGDADIVACIAGDTNHFDSFRDLLGAFSTWSRDHVYPHGAGGPNVSFSFLTQHYMTRTGATREDFGKLCVAQRHNAKANPLALLRGTLTLDDYMAARPVAPPIHLFDCVMPCAGGDGFLVMHRQKAQALGLPFVRILGAIERHNAFPDDPVQDRGGWAVDQPALWAQAGVGPGDIDMLQSYDDYPVICMMQIEDLGFCAKGEAPDFIRQHDLTAQGDFPHNTGGGQLSMGQAGAAGGYLGMVEAIRQLTGQGGARQVANARHAMVSGFGMINYDRGLCTAATILAAA